MMRLFHENHPNKTVDDRTVVVNDFTRRTPFWSYRTVSYKEYPPLLELEKLLDGYLRELFKGELDEANGDALDNLIFDYVRQAELDLAQQRCRHRDMINSFDIRAKGDRNAFEGEKRRLEAALAENAGEQADIRRRREKVTFEEEIRE